MNLDPQLEPARIRTGDYGSPPGVSWGAFRIFGPAGRELLILAADGSETGWEHVSVSTKKHTPNWAEMCFVKNLFWPPDQAVVQFHPPADQYVNNFSNCLHLWRSIKAEFPIPPAILVGYKNLGTLA